MLHQRIVLSVVNTFTPDRMDCPSSCCEQLPRIDSKRFFNDKRKHAEYDPEYNVTTNTHFAFSELVEEANNSVTYRLWACPRASHEYI